MIELMNGPSLRISLVAAVCCLWLPAGAVAAQASRVTLSRAPSVSQDDYPERARRLEVQGLVVVDVAVDPTGVATGCTPIEIERPGYGLEEATCNIWMRRARFSAARNASGVAIPGTYRAQILWSIPEPEPEPPAPAIVSPNPVARAGIPVQTAPSINQTPSGSDVFGITQSWALVPFDSNFGFGIDWLSYDNFGNNQRDIDVIKAWSSTSPEGVDYEIAVYVFDCNQPRFFLRRGAYFRIDGTKYTDYRPESTGTGEWRPTYSNSSTELIRQMVCDAWQPGFNQFKDAASFVAYFRSQP